MDGFTLMFLLILAFWVGWIGHWMATRRQRKLLKEYRHYKKALASVDQAILANKTTRRKNGR